MPEKSLFQVEIAPLTIISQRRSPLFSYLSKNPVSEGSLVSIPFGKRKLEGIAFSCRPFTGRPPHWMKYVEKVREAAHLTPAQSSLALFLSKTYFTPLGNCLKHFIVPQKTGRKEKAHAPTSPQTVLPKFSPQRHKISQAFLKKEKVPKVFIPANFHSEQETLLSFLGACLKKKKTVLIVVPELVLALWWKAELSPFFKKDLIVIHSKLKGSELSTAWETVRKREANILLGTRQALFAPFGKLDHILIMDEEDETSYKQWEMSPRYTVRAVAFELSRLMGAQLLFASPTPSLRVFHGISTKELKKIIDPTLRKRAAMTLVNLRFQKKKDRGVFSPELTAGVESALRQKKTVLLLGKQSGLATLIVCDSCHTVLRCPKCERTLVSTRKGTYACLGCGFETDPFPSCAKCGHMTFKNYGKGTEKIEIEARKLFPRARVIRLERGSRENREAFEKNIRTIREGAFDILVGTFSSIKIPALPRISLIAMIQADDLLSFPEYQAEEKLIRTVERLRLLAPANGSVLLQTFEPEAPIFREALENYEKETGRLLAERKMLGYPPYLRYLKIECPAATLSLSEKQAQKLFRDLSLFLEKEKLPLSLLPTHLPLAVSRQKHYQFFVRFPGDNPIPKSLGKWCLLHSHECLFDLDPLNLN